MTPWYIALKPFGPADGEAWTDYVAWSGLTQLEELVSLDGLCERLLPDVEPDHWGHIVEEDFTLDVFTDLAFLEAKIAGLGPRNLLAVYRNPPPDPPAPSDRFDFLGYDVVDAMGAVSALSNCGGFELAFSNAELNRFGLVDRRERAVEIQAALRRRYPGEHHADCHVWAIFRARD